MTDSEFVEKYMAELEKQEAELNNEKYRKDCHRMSFSDVQIAMITTPPVTI